MTGLLSYLVLSILDKASAGSQMSSSSHAGSSPDGLIDLDDYDYVFLFTFRFSFHIVVWSRWQMQRTWYQGSALYAVHPGLQEFHK